MNLNNLTLNEIKHIKRLCLKRDNYYNIELFNILDRITEETSFTYKELLNVKIKEI
tara:strand:+ start:80 stop:247 length:168 start_codon:yes stop_codon:yes gene_type:complete